MKTAWIACAIALVTLDCSNEQVNVQLPRVDLSQLPLPRAPDGNLTIIEIAGSRLELTPSLADPLTALGTCTDTITYCTSTTRGLDDCVDAPPNCHTERPWEEPTPCCPAACSAAYHQARSNGVAPLEAFQNVYFRQPDCFPGARALLEGQ